jgi:hypothetical protein
MKKGVITAVTCNCETLWESKFVVAVGVWLNYLVVRIGIPHGTSCVVSEVVSFKSNVQPW